MALFLFPLCHLTYVEASIFSSIFGDSALGLSVGVVFTVDFGSANVFVWSGSCVWTCSGVSICEMMGRCPIGCREIILTGNLSLPTLSFHLGSSIRSVHEGESVVCLLSLWGRILKTCLVAKRAALV